MLFSVIVPVYNRPDEVRDLLESLCKQNGDHFEVLIVEDGSDKTCRSIAESYEEKLQVRYFQKENSGQGFSRNYGFERACGDYLVVFDSDCIIPPHYFDTVRTFLKKHPVDAWGGPDRAHPDFSAVQKAISYAMTSFFTTAGIRGDKRHTGTFHPRSFNMGISREVYEKTGGYRITRMGEDLEFSIRILKNGFKVALIQDAFVYHKRRTNFRQFFRQLHFFGRARININRFHPGEIKWLHLMPALFLVGFLIVLFLLLVNPPFFWPMLMPYFLFALLLFSHSLYDEKSLRVALLSTIAGFTLLTAYGAGFLQEWLRDKWNSFATLFSKV